MMLSSSDKMAAGYDGTQSPQSRWFN